MASNQIRINLLPTEITVQQAEREKFLKIQLFSLAIAGVAAFIASAVVSLRFIQAQDINKAEAAFQVTQEEVGKFQKQEGALVVLKNRLAGITPILSDPSKQRLIYNLIVSLTPSSIQVSSLVLDGASNAAILLSASSSEVLDNFLDSLVDPTKNGGKISSVDIENLSRNRDGVYRAGLKVKVN